MATLRFTPENKPTFTSPIPPSDNDRARVYRTSPEEPNRRHSDAESDIESESFNDVVETLNTNIISLSTRAVLLNRTHSHLLRCSVRLNHVLGSEVQTDGNVR